MSSNKKVNNWSYIIFLVLCILILVLGYMILVLPESCCNPKDLQVLNRISNQVNHQGPHDENPSIPSPEIVEGNDTIVDGVIVKTPTTDCRAHFSGLILSDEYIYRTQSKIFEVDESSEYVGSGDYPRAIEAFPKSHNITFDGIAIDKGTRVIIYEKPFFKGKILLDEVGPLMITNKIRLEGGPEWTRFILENNNKVFIDELNKLFPPNRRVMSSSNMFNWSNGSLKVICNE